MNNLNNNLSLLARLLMSIIFIFSGVGKIAAPAAAMGYIASMGVPFPIFALTGSIVIELVGGLLLAFGLQTRVTALALAAFTLVTGMIFHSAIGDQNQLFHLLKNLAMGGGLLQIAAFGAGALSLDARRASKIKLALHVDG